MKRLGRETATCVADSTSWKLSKNNYLPGRVIDIVRGKFKASIKEDSVAKGKCENWIAVISQHNKKIIIIMSMCRLPVAFSQGPRRCVTQ